MIIAVPVILISLISLSMYFSFLWIKQLLIKDTAPPVEEHYHLELDLIKNEFVHIIMVEDEFDSELTLMNESWRNNVYNEETCLYRVRTVPVIPILEGVICCFYYKEQAGGVLLQVIVSSKVTDNQVPGSELVFLDYEKLVVSLIDETGAFFLYNDEKNTQLINGFNMKETIQLQLNIL